MIGPSSSLLDKFGLVADSTIYKIWNVKLVKNENNTTKVKRLSMKYIWMQLGEYIMSASTPRQSC